MEALKFGRWLLKYCDTYVNSEALLCWKYNNKEYDTDELYVIFKMKTKKK